MTENKTKDKISKISFGSGTSLSKIVFEEQLKANEWTYKNIWEPFFMDLFVNWRYKHECRHMWE